MRNTVDRVNYVDWVKGLGLSTHPQQAARRMQKWSQHFSTQNNVIYISAEYAQFLQDCKELTHTCIKLKGGNYEN